MPRAGLSAGWFLLDASACFRCSACRSTSSRRSRLPSVATSSARSPSSRSARRADGVTAGATRCPPDDGEDPTALPGGWDVVPAAAFSAVGARVAAGALCGTCSSDWSGFDFWTGWPSCSKTAIVSPIETLSPSCLRILASTPAAGAGSSVEALSVSSSTTFSSSATASPSRLSQRPICTSWMDSPRIGIFNSMLMVMLQALQGPVDQQLLFTLVCRRRSGGRAGGLGSSDSGQRKPS